MYKCNKNTHAYSRKKQQQGSKSVCCKAAKLGLLLMMKSSKVSKLGLLLSRQLKRMMHLGQVSPALKVSLLAPMAALP